MYRYTSPEPFIANTDRAWFDFLASRAVGGRVDEVNFWLPKATRPLKAMSSGEPLFFRLKMPDCAVAGYGFFAHFAVIDLHTVWSTFEWKNGDPDKQQFFSRIGNYRGVDLLDPMAKPDPIGCMVLRDATFWPQSRWISWREDEGWHRNLVQGKTERDPCAEVVGRVGGDRGQAGDLRAEFAARPRSRPRGRTRLLPKVGGDPNENSTSPPSLVMTLGENSSALQS
jgi:hypothetical protein